MSYDVCIVGGLGHVGLPLGITLALGGAQVALYDTNEAGRHGVRSGRMPFVEAGAEQALNEVIGKSLHVVDCPVEAEHTVIAVGTPIDEYQNPRTEAVFGAVQGLGIKLRHICLRSTVFPGTTRRLARMLKGETLVSFCPERILQGRAMAELRELPQIVSGTTPQAESAAGGMFRKFMPGVQTVPASVEEAELAKLFLNAWRYIRFAGANQFYELATELGVDYGNVQRVMKEGYARGADIPGPGFAAGPCLLKDTMQLAAVSPNSFPLGQAARLVNEGFPDFIVRRLQQAGIELKNYAKVGILGMAFKSDIDDVRDSLGFKLKRLLEFAGAFVMASDEYHAGHGTKWRTKEEVIAAADIVIIGVPHSAYVGLPLQPWQTVVDPWGVTKGGKRL